MKDVDVNKMSNVTAEFCIRTDEMLLDFADLSIDEDQ